jgi:hypothetical protein
VWKVTKEKLSSSLEATAVEDEVATVEDKVATVERVKCELWRRHHLWRTRLK